MTDLSGYTPAPAGSVTPAQNEGQSPNNMEEGGMQGLSPSVTAQGGTEMMMILGDLAERALSTTVFARKRKSTLELDNAAKKARMEEEARILNTRTAVEYMDQRWDPALASIPAIYACKYTNMISASIGANTVPSCQRRYPHIHDIHDSSFFNRAGAGVNAGNVMQPTALAKIYGAEARDGAIFRRGSRLRLPMAFAMIRPISGISKFGHQISDSIAMLYYCAFMRVSQADFDSLIDGSVSAERRASVICALYFLDECTTADWEAAAALALSEGVSVVLVNRFHCMKCKTCSRAPPPIDLTTQGIEPNPGPKGGQKGKGGGKSAKKSDVEKARQLRFDENKNTTVFGTIDDTASDTTASETSSSSGSTTSIEESPHLICKYYALGTCARKNCENRHDGIERGAHKDYKGCVAKLLGHVCHADCVQCKEEEAASQRQQLKLSKPAAQGYAAPAADHAVAAPPTAAAPYVTVKEPVGTHADGANTRNVVVPPELMESTVVPRIDALFPGAHAYLTGNTARAAHYQMKLANCDVVELPPGIVKQLVNFMVIGNRSATNPVDITNCAIEANKIVSTLAITPAQVLDVTTFGVTRALHDYGEHCSRRHALEHGYVGPKIFAGAAAVAAVLLLVAMYVLDVFTSGPTYAGKHGGYWTAFTPTMTHCLVNADAGEYAQRLLQSQAAGAAAAAAWVVAKALSAVRRWPVLAVLSWVTFATSAVAAAVTFGHAVAVRGWGCYDVTWLSDAEYTKLEGWWKLQQDGGPWGWAAAKYAGTFVFPYYRRIVEFYVPEWRDDDGSWWRHHSVRGLIEPLRKASLAFAPALSPAWLLAGGHSLLLRFSLSECLYLVAALLALASCYNRWRKSLSAWSVASVAQAVAEEMVKRVALPLSGLIGLLDHPTVHGAVLAVASSALVAGLNAGYGADVSAAAAALCAVVVVAVGGHAVWSGNGKSFARGVFSQAAHIALALLPFNVAVIIHMLNNDVNPWSLRCLAGEADRMQTACRKFMRQGYRVYLTSNVDIPVSKLREGAKMTKPKRRGKRQHDERTGSQVMLGFEVEKYRNVVYGVNEVNEECALKARCLKQTPVPDAAFMREFTTFVKSEYHELIGSARLVPVDFKPWLDGCNSSPSVKADIQKAKNETTAAGWSYGSRISRRDAVKATKRKSFPKMENLFLRGPFGRVLKASRLIQGALGQFTAWVGPFISAMQSYVKTKLDGRGGILFTSGVSADFAANYIGSAPSGYNVLEDDIGAFDSSISEELCELEVWMAKQQGAPPLVLQLMRANIKTHGRTSTGYQYSCKGTRKSGDPYTSCFNSMLNAFMKVFLFCKARECSVAEFAAQARMLVQGDDNLMVYAGPQIDFEPGMTRLGFKSECTHRKDREGAEFCSMILSRTETGWCFLPKSGRLLSKLCSFVNPPDADAKCLVRGVALGLRGQCSRSCILGPVIRRLLELTEGSQAILPKGLEHQMVHTAAEPDAFTRYVEHSRYNLSHADEGRLSDELGGLKLGDKWASGLAERICDRDTSAKQAMFGAPDLNVAVGHAMQSCVDAAKRPRRTWSVRNTPTREQCGADRKTANNRTYGVRRTPLRYVARLATLAACLMLVAVPIVSLEHPPTLKGNLRTEMWPESSTEWSMKTSYVRAGTLPHEITQSGTCARGPRGKCLDTDRTRDIGTDASSCVSYQPGFGAFTRRNTTMSSHAHKKPTFKRQSTKKKSIKKVVRAVERVAKTAKVHGRGDYDYKIGGKPAGRAVGEAVGSLFGSTGSAIGGAIGHGAQWLTKTLFGFGDYRERNEALSSHLADNNATDSSILLSGALPQFAHVSNSTADGIEVCFEEMVGQVYGSQSFNSTYYSLNPGSSWSPWLRQVSAAYTQYQFTGMIFQVRSLVGSASATGGPLGQITLSTQYNPFSVPFPNMVAAVDNMYSSTAKASDSLVHMIECKDSATTIPVKFIRSPNQLVPADALAQYDLGKIAVCTQGMPTDGGLVGTLYVTYRVRLLKPTIQNLSYGLPNTSHIYGSLPATGNTITMFDGAIYNGTLPVVGKGNTLTFTSGGRYTMIMTSSAPTAVVTNGFNYVLGTRVTLVKAFQYKDGALSSSVADTNSYSTQIIAFTVDASRPATTPDYTTTSPSWNGTAVKPNFDIFVFPTTPELGTSTVGETVEEAVRRMVDERMRDALAGPSSSAPRSRADEPEDGEMIERCYPVGRRYVEDHR